MSGYTVRGKAPSGTEIELAAPGGKTVRVTVTTKATGRNLGHLQVRRRRETAEEFGVPFLGNSSTQALSVEEMMESQNSLEPDGPASLAFAEVVAQIQSKVESGSTDSGLEII